MYSTLWRLLHFIFLLLIFPSKISEITSSKIYTFIFVFPLLLRFTLQYPVPSHWLPTNTVSGENFITLKNQQFLLIYMRAIWVFSWGLDIPRCKWWPSWHTHWVFICLCAYLYISVCVCIFLRVCLCICVCMCVWLAQM